LKRQLHENTRRSPKPPRYVFPFGVGSVQTSPELPGCKTYPPNEYQSDHRALVDKRCHPEVKVPE
jgi:hypothetical protein